MPAMTVKEWAAAYRRDNEWEQQERITRLPHETVEDSVRSYFALCTLLLSLFGQAEQSDGLWDLRLRYYEALAEKWRRLARRMEYAAQP